MRHDVKITKNRRKPFQQLMSPIYIGEVRLPTRLALAPINTGYARDNLITERLIEFHARIAEGGVGLSVIGATAVAMNGISNLTSFSLDNDLKINGLKTLVERIKRYDTVLSIQLNHAGRKVDPEIVDVDMVAPSAIPKHSKAKTPRPLTTPEIKKLIDSFGQAARRAISAGVEIIQIHCAHGHLIHQFLSPLSNVREDAYGGSLGNRAKFALEIIECVRHQIGNKIPIMCRISADDLLDKGLTIDDMKQVVTWLVDVGVDAIDVSAGTQRQDILPDKDSRLGTFVDYAQEIRTAIKVPVLVAGNIPNLSIAETIVASGKADIISFGRQLIADPYFIVKCIHNNFGSVVWCTKCGECSYRLHKRPFLSCPLNSSL